MCGHLGGRSQCKNIDHHPFSIPAPLALHQALWLGLMAPDSNISLRWFLTSSTIGGGIHLNHSLKGVLSVTFIVCSVEWVQPSSAGSNENMSWYLARSCRLHLPTLGPRNPGCLNLVHQTAYHVFA